MQLKCQKILEIVERQSRINIISLYSVFYDEKGGLFVSLERADVESGQEMNSEIMVFQKDGS